MIIRFVLGVATLFGTAGTVIALDACDLVSGDKLFLDDLDAVIGGLPGGVFEKDPFETNAEFEARKKAAFISLEKKTVVLASSVDQENAIYDAEAGAWFLTRYFPSNASFDFVAEAIFKAGLIEHIGFNIGAPFDDEKDRVESIMLRSADEIVDDYYASNALGATIAVKKWHHSRVAIAEIGDVADKPRTKYKNGTELFAFEHRVQVENTLGSGTHLQSALRVDMPRDKARAMNGKIGFAIVADLQAPVRVDGQYYIEPKFDRPNERTVDTVVLIADIRCGIAFGPDLSVLATIHTNPPF